VDVEPFKMEDHCRALEAGARIMLAALPSAEEIEPKNQAKDQW